MRHHPHMVRTLVTFGVLLASFGAYVGHSQETLLATTVITNLIWIWAA